MTEGTTALEGSRTVLSGRIPAAAEQARLTAAVPELVKTETRQKMKDMRGKDWEEAQPPNEEACLPGRTPHPQRLPLNGVS